MRFVAKCPNRVRLLSIRTYIVATCVALSMVLPPSARAENIRVMAAFTFKRALDEVVQAYTSEAGGQVLPQYGMTPMLAKQVENLAPADIFLSADTTWMNYLQDHGLIQNGTRVDLLTADLVLVARSDNTAAPTDALISPDYPLAKIIGQGRIAMCNPADDPAGRLGRAGLEKLGLWPSIANQIALAESPPAAVTLVARGEAPMALAFSTNVAGVPGVKISGVFPRDSHPPIAFPAAILRDSHNADAPRFLAFLRSPKATALFEKFGYQPISAKH